MSRKYNQRTITIVTKEVNELLDLIPKRKRSAFIGQFNENTLIQIFSSVKNAELTTGVKAPYIRKCLRGERKYAGGFIWKKIEY